MPLKFYTDTHIAKQVAVQLRECGVEVVRCQEVGMEDASDQAHLTYTAEKGYTLVSMDDDFIHWHYTWLAEGKPHSGIFKVSHDLQGDNGIGQIVKELFTYYELVETAAATLEVDIYQQILFIR